jgi:hypothetical protein
MRLVEITGDRRGREKEDREATIRLGAGACPHNAANHYIRNSFPTPDI